MKCARVDSSERAVLEPALALTMEHVTPLMAPVNAILAGLEVTVLKPARQDTGARTVSTPATATMEPTAVLMMGNASARQDGRVCTAHRGAR